MVRSSTSSVVSVASDVFLCTVPNSTSHEVIVLK